jgi:hypothetical protein
MVIALASSIAHACPACQGHGSYDGGFGWILGAMILLPFPTAAAVIWVIRKGSLDSNHREVGGSDSASSAGPGQQEEHEEQP